MTASNKVIKASFVSEEWLNLQQTFAKKLYKQQLKNKETNKVAQDQETKSTFRKDFEKW